MGKPRARRRVVPGTSPGTLTLPEGSMPAVLNVMAFGPQGHEEFELEGSLDLAALRRKWAVVWLDLRGLGDGELLKRLAGLFDIHRLSLADVVHVPQRPKLEAYEAHDFLVLQQVDRDRPTEVEQVSLFVGEGFVLTIQEHSGDWFEGVRERIRAGSGIIRKETAGYLAYALVDAVVDSYFPALERLGESLETLEERIVTEPSVDLMTELRDLKRHLLLLRRQAWPQRELVGQLQRSERDWFSNEARTHLRDCHDHAVRVLDLLDLQRELASGVMEFHVSMVGHRMNEVMKVLTMMATIFIPLSFVAGLYGMNFDTSASSWNMPELALPFGYPAVLLLMSAMAGGMLLFFKSKGWIGKGR